MGCAVSGLGNSRRVWCWKKMMNGWMDERIERKKGREKGRKKVRQCVVSS